MGQFFVGGHRLYRCYNVCPPFPAIVFFPGWFMVRLAARTWGAILRAALVTLFVPALLTAADNNACKLLTATELEPVVGGKLSAFKGESYSSAVSCSSWPLAKRSMLSTEASSTMAVLPCSMRSETILPVAGACITPCPLKPLARQNAG